MHAPRTARARGAADGERLPRIGQAIGQVLSLAVGVALSPVPVIAVVLMLTTPSARTNGPAFIAGWILGVAGAGTILLLLAGGAQASTRGAPEEWVSFLKIGLGVLLLVIAARQWRARPRAGEEPEMPSWMKTIDTFGAPKAAGTGVLLSAANPKNLILIAGAAAAIAQTGTSSGGQAVALAVFVVIATVGPGIPVGIYFLMRDRAAEILEGLRGWMARGNNTIMAVICIIIAAKLIGDAISSLSA
jgi:threonine/homoserine/homoserine lactone efflux protein